MHTGKHDHVCIGFFGFLRQAQAVANVICHVLNIALLVVVSQQNSVYMQIGVIMLIGLAAKNAILIVEFAKVRVDSGMGLIKATLEASRLRLRPILMTSLAFIIGCLPLALATGAGAAARNNMGIAVVGGMAIATTFGIFLIPVMYVVVEKVAAFFRKKKEHRKQNPDEYM